VKVVTLRQPEATAVVLGVARRLWRGRCLHYRGPLRVAIVCFFAAMFAHAVWIQVRNLGREGLILLGLARNDD
jgi:hypothetical protein